MPLRAPGASIVSLGGETMGTTWSVKLVQPASVSTAALCGGLERALASIVCEMSTWIGDSNISRFNDAAPGAWHAMPDDLMVVLRHALAVAEMSEGAYDPTAGALVELWGFGPHGRPHVPAEDAIAAARLRCGWQRIRVDGNRVYQPGGVRLDFSSIAKGFAVDKASAYLHSLGKPDHLVEIGGELSGSGTKPDGGPWWVALESPPLAADNHGSQLRETVVALHGLAIATSGDSQRYFQHEGRRLSHTIDPRTGYPASDQLTSVTVFHRRCIRADALATALAVLGPDEGFRFALDHDVAARFVLSSSLQVGDQDDSVDVGDAGLTDTRREHARGFSLTDSLPLSCACSAALPAADARRRHRKN